MPAPAKKEAYDVDADRGIQNATSRFKQQREGALLSSELLRKAAGGHVRERGDASRGGVPERSEGRGPRDSARQSMSIRMREAGRALFEVSNRENLGYSEADTTALVENIPQKPAFPMIMVTAAILKDIVDGADVTGIGIIATTAISFLISLVLFLWFLGKMSGMQRWLWKRYVIAMVIEFIPIIKIIPATTILVLAAHYRETKIVRIINESLQKFSGRSRMR